MNQTQTQIAQMPSTLAMLAGVASAGLCMLAALVFLVADSESGFKIGLAIFAVAVGVGLGATAMLAGLVSKKLSA